MTSTGSFSTWLSNISQHSPPQTISNKSLTSLPSIQGCVDWEDFDEITIASPKANEHRWFMDQAKTREMYRTRADSGYGGRNPYRLTGVPDRDSVRERYRLSDVPDRPKTRRGRPSVDSTEQLPQPRTERRTGRYGSINASEPPNESFAVEYMDANALARLEGRDCFDSVAASAEEEELQRASVDFFGGAVTYVQPASRFSDDSAPPLQQQRRPSLLRSVSNKVKGLGSLRRRSVRGRPRAISRPASFRNLDPDCVDPHEPHPDHKAIPIVEAQHRFMTAYLPVDSQPLDSLLQHYEAVGWPNDEIAVPAPETPVEKPAADDSKYPFALRAKCSKWKRPAHRLRPLGSSVAVADKQPRKIKVVGSPDRMTQFGDFVDYSSSTQDQDEYTEEERAILDIKPLRPKHRNANLRAESLSQPAGCLSLPRPAKVTSQQDWRMSEEYPTVADLFDQIDIQIADSKSIPHAEKPAVNREAHRLHSILNRPPPGADYMADEDEVPVVDTFVQEGHTEWVVTSRPDERTVRSDYRMMSNAPEVARRCNGEVRLAIARPERPEWRDRR